MVKDSRKVPENFVVCISAGVLIPRMTMQRCIPEAWIAMSREFVTSCMASCMCSTRRS